MNKPTIAILIIIASIFSFIAYRKDQREDFKQKNAACLASPSCSREAKLAACKATPECLKKQEAIRNWLNDSSKQQSGYDAGYEWADENDIEDSDECEGKSQAFINGCKDYALDKIGNESIENEDLNLPARR